MKNKTSKAHFGWCMYDWANSAFATIILAAVLPVYFVSLVPADGARLFFAPGHSFAATSLWGYSVAISMLLIALIAPALGALADRRGWHKGLLAGFCLTGCCATALLALPSGNNYLLAAGLFILANFSFAGSNIFYNAYLPHLVPLQDADRLSARGYAYGYIGGGLMLALVFALILKHDLFGFSSVAAATRFGFLLTALWWFAFALPTFIFLPATAKSNQPVQSFTLANYLARFRKLLRYRDLCLFLLAFLCYNDGIQTLISVSAVYAREEMQLGQSTIIGCFLMIQFMAMPGAILFGRMGVWLGTLRSIVLSLVIFLAVCCYAYVMNSALEFWILGAVIALVLGGSQALSRSLYASMVPLPQAAEFFGFFTISSRFAAIFGPLLFALISDLSGSSRDSILALGVFFIIGGFLLLKVNVARGRALAIDHN